MDDKNWPSWRYGPEGASTICASEADVPKGWVDHPSKVAEKPAKAAPAAPAAPAAAKPADAAKAAPAGDAAAKPAKGAGRPPSELGIARAAHKAKFGKAPSPKMTLDEINAKLQAPIDL